MMDKSMILRRFGIMAEPDTIVPIGGGHINDTFKAVDSSSGRAYILQRINHNVFTDVELLQSNIERVTAHIRAKLQSRGENDIDRKVLKFIKASDTGKTYVRDGDSYWRVMLMIEDAETRGEITPENARNAGKAIGHFQEMLSDIDGGIGESIPDFHNMELRLRQFRQAIDADPCGRLAQVTQLVEELKKREGKACMAERLYREGRMPKHVATATRKSTTCSSTVMVRCCA